MTGLSNLNPDELPLYELLGLLQSEAAADPAATLAVADAALVSRGPSPWLYAVVGVCELALGDTEAARDASREAIGLLPDDPALVLYAAPVLLATEAEREALVALTRIARQEHDSVDVQALLAEAWLAVDEGAKAGPALSRLRDLDPEDRRLPQLEAKLQAGDETTPVYVRTLFDGYADRFDADLVGKLNYITPEVLAGMLESVLGDRQDLNICDVGCGTGLMGNHLRPYAARLEGIDLSPRMLTQAAKTGLYDELVASELVSFLNEENSVYDLIVAADVLVYIGALEDLFMAAKASIRAGGWLAISVEKLVGKSEAGCDFQQLPTRRFAHSAAYLRKLCAAHGFTLEQMAEFQPRREGKNFIDGLAILARRD